MRSRYQDQIMNSKQQLEQRQQELMQLLAGNASVDQLQAKHGEVEALRQALDRIHFENLLAMRDVLTLEQRQQLVDHLQHRRDNPPASHRPRHR
ncbi:MAG: hypothetical protein LVS60_12985 [Nodosilinea sp. LVE1205-7]